MAARAESPDYEVMEAAMSVLARKLRAELTVGLLEDYVQGRRTGRSMLAEFDRAQGPFRSEHDFSPLAEDLTALRDPQNVVDAEPARPRTWAIDAMGQIAPANPEPEWERLRQQARDRDRPIALWEVFKGLDELADRVRQGRQTGDRDVAVIDIENAMDLQTGVGAEWSLHREVAQARAKLGDGVVPGDPRVLAAMLLRVDAARSLIKPGGFEIGIRPGPQGPARSINETTMQRLEAAVRPESVRHMTAQAAFGLIRTHADSALQRDVDRAVTAGDAAVLARRAHAAAESARERAAEVRGQRFGARSSLLYGATAAAGAGITAASLAGQTSLSVQVTIGLALTTLGAAGNLIKDWRPHSEALWAPYRAAMAEKVAQLADRLESRTQDELNHGGTARAWTRAGALFRAAETTGLRRAVSRLERPAEPVPPQQEPSPATRPSAERGRR